MKTYTILLFIFFPTLMIAQVQNREEKKEQDNNMLISFGPAVNYFDGEYPGSFEKYESKYINVQVNGFLGYLSSRSNRKNAIGLFGTAGYTNKTSFNKMLQIQEIVIGQLDSSNFYTFYQIEAGMIAGKFLRFSSGYGQQYYKTNLGTANFEYFSSTLGLMIDLGSLVWNIDVNLNYGLDFPKTTMKLSTGFLVMF